MKPVNHQNANPMLSVIIPCYDIGSYLGQCLDSVLKQKAIKQTEIICINDGSADDTGQVLESYKNKYSDNIKVLSHKNNYGVSLARNYGLSEARGKYVMFLDGDDWIGYKFAEDERIIDSWYLNKFITGITCYDNVAVSIGNLIRHDTDMDPKINNMLIYESNVMNDTNKILDFLDRRVSSCAALYNNEIIKGEKLSFKKDLLYFEDAHFITSYILHSCDKYPNAALLHDAFYMYRNRKGSAMYNLCASHEGTMRRLERTRNRIFHYSNLVIKCTDKRQKGHFARMLNISARRLSRNLYFINRYQDLAPTSASLYGPLKKYVPKDCIGCQKHDCTNCINLKKLISLAKSTQKVLG